MSVHKVEQSPSLDPSNLANPHASEGFLFEKAPVGYTAVHGLVEVGGAVSRVTVTVPLELESSSIMIEENGFGAFKKTMRGISNSIAELGYATVRSSPIRSSDRSSKEVWEDPTRIHVDQLGAVVDRLADGDLLKGVPNAKELDVNKIILVPHSYGGDPAVKFSLEHPEAVESLVMLMPVGMEDADPLRFAKRLPAFVRKELLPLLMSRERNLGVGDAHKALVHFFEDPVQTVGEIKACMLADNRAALHDLHARDIGTALLSGNDDNLLPADNMETLAASMVDYYERLDVNHLGPQNKNKVVAQAAVRAAKVLAAERQMPALKLVR